MEYSYEQFIHYTKCKTLKKIREDRIWSIYLKSAVLVLSLLGLESCTPSMYHADLKYQPSGKLCQLNSKKMSHYTVTIAKLNDIRKIDDKLLIGKVMNGSGGSIPILPKYINVADSVSLNIKEFLTNLGYKVANETPSWDLKQETIHQDWGNMLVGGNIDELEIICEDSIFVTTYRAKVKLSFVFANVPEKRIFDRLTIRSSTSLKDVSMAEKTINEQINAAFSDVIESIFCDAATTKKIEEAMKSMLTAN